MRRVRIGNQTAWTASTPFEPFEYALENRFDAFEWFPDKKENGSGWDEDDISRSMRSYIRRTAKEYDLALSVHAPWNANPLQDENHDTFKKSITFALDIGANLLNIHLFPDYGIKNYLTSIIPIVDQLSTSGMFLAIENTPTTSPDHFNSLFSMLTVFEEIRKGIIGMCLDLGHANLNGPYRNNYLTFIDALDPAVNIIHMHLHENYGDSDSHLPIFTGPSGTEDTGIKGLIKRLRDRDFSGSIILEQWPTPPSLLNRARDRLCDLLNQSAVQ